ncbi:MAG: ATP-dependent DNA helicase RecG [Cryobacterium sp.]
MTGSDSDPDLFGDPGSVVVPDVPEVSAVPTAINLELRETDSLGSVNLDTDLTRILGKRSATALGTAFGMRTVADLLGHYPRRYELRGESTVLSQLPLDENATVVAEVVSAVQRTMKNRPGTVVEVTISDGRGMLTLIFFSKTSQKWRLDELRPGVRGIFAGKVTLRQGHRQLAHPAYRTFEGELADAADPRVKRLLLEIIPIYPATAAFTSWQIQACLELVFAGLAPVPDPVPEQLLRAENLMPQGRALELIHRPHSQADWEGARDTLRFTEAWVLQCALVQQRLAARERLTTSRMPVAGGLLERFDAALPFDLTSDQHIVAAELAHDLADTAPMNRLLQGEVGSGKTVVALRAMLAVADSGGQAAFLAPTEVLASQHLRSITAMLGPDLAAEIMPTLLTGQLPAAEKRRALLGIVSGQARIVVGTHALLSDNVAFFDLGLVVIDEQHRFGVDQRETLRLKAARPPHTLVLTATPIPRTLAMTVFGDLDVSTITVLPVGRQGITSVVVPLSEHPEWFLRIWERLAEELSLGRQAFVVCPAIAPKDIEEQPGASAASPEAAGTNPNARNPTGSGHRARPVDPDAVPLTDVETLLGRLQAHAPLAGARIAALHGRMTSEEKDQTMRAFAAGEIDVIVATTVIEVGVDVPNASAMVVMDAERFGVSQLHQLRGRVGRGSVPGLCLLVTHAAPGSNARERIDAVAGTLDGFRLADLDLALRQEGNVLGNTQSGDRSALRLLRVATDGGIIARARIAAVRLVTGDPRLGTEPVLRDAVARRLDDSERTWLRKS